MAECSELQCESCQYEHVTKTASQWCTDCEEGFCSECCRGHKAAKRSRNHHIIPVDEYQRTKEFSVKLNCPNHNKQLDFHCPTHDSVLCVMCVQSKHSSCKLLMPLNEAAKCAKTSIALRDLEQTIDGILENIETIVRHLQQHTTYLKEQEDVTKKSIATKRAEINKHLDRLEEKLMKEVTSETEKAKKEITLIMTKFETKRKTILDLKNTAKNMNQISSNLQVFVGIRGLQNNIVNEKNGIELLVNSIPELSIAVQINPKFDTFTEAFDTLGEIQITFKEAVVPHVKRRLIQAQYQRPADPPVHKLDNLQLKLRKIINFSGKKSSVSSCLILPNKSIMIASRNKPSLTILKKDGSYDRDISVPYHPYDVTIIDDQSVAVSYENQRCITIVNIHNPRTNQTLENLCKRRIWGITYNDDKLYAVAPEEGIKVIDLDGNIIKTIRIYNDAWNTFKVTTQKDKIYYSVNNGSVHCVDMEGTEIWKYRNDRLNTKIASADLAVDNYGITFAAGHDNNLLLAISPDGKHQQVLLTSCDVLLHPNAVYYEKDSKRLLVCNKNDGHAALYDVIS